MSMFTRRRAKARAMKQNRIEGMEESVLALERQTKFIKENGIGLSIYQLPLKYDYNDGCIMTSNNIIAISLIDETRFNESAIRDLVEILNNERCSYFRGKWKAKGCDVLYEGKPAFSVRGWGFLTGTLKFSDEAAMEVQDSFVKYVLNKLNNN